MKKIVLFFVLLSSLFMFACSKENNKMEIKGNDTIEVGFSSEYKVFYDNQVLSESEFYWIIDNTDVAARAGGTLYGLETGTVNIKAVLKEDPSIYVGKTVKIIESVVESISLRNAKSDVKVGDQFIVTILSEPSDAVYDVEAIWECDKDDIVAIDKADDSAIITALNEGTVTITVTCSSASASFTLNVAKAITEIEMYNDIEASVSSVLYLDFNIDNPVIKVLTENIELTGNYIYAKEEGVAKIKVSQKNNKKLEAKTFEINIVKETDKFEDATSEEQALIDSYLSKMSVKQKLGQMFMLDLQTYQSGWRIVQYSIEMDDKGVYYYANNDASNSDYLSSLLKNYPFGNLIIDSSISQNGSNVSNLVLGMQTSFVNNNRIGGIVHVINNNDGSLGDGFNEYLNNLTIGTINDYNLASKYFDIYANDLAAAGVNSYSAYAYSSSGSSKDRFSNVYSKQVLYSSIYYNSFKNNGLGLSPIVSYENNDNSLYIQSAIYEGIDSISITDNATASSVLGTSIAKKLRDSGYKGLIIDVDNHYDPENYMVYEGRWDYDFEYYYLTDYYVNAIKDGVNLFRLNIFLENSSDRRNYRNIARNEETFNFLNELENKVNDGTISINDINESVKKILLYKIRHNLIQGTYPIDEYTPNDDNQKYINSIDNGYNTIAMTGTFKAINKAKEVDVIFGDSDVTSLIGNASYISRGYKDLSRYQIGKDFFDENSEKCLYKKLSEDSQVLMFISGEYYTYMYTEPYTDGEGNTYDAVYYENARYKDILIEVLKHTSNVTLIFLDDPTDGDDYSEFDCLKIYLNYNGWDNFNPLFDVLEKGNASGVTINEK